MKTTHVMMIIAVSALSVIAQNLRAQVHVNELFPREGEQRFNQFQWVGSHNSFQRSNGLPGGVWSIAEQTDEIGMRHFEIDVGWEADLPSRYPDIDGDFIVKHFCQDLVGAQTLDDILAQIALSDAIMGEHHSFIYINFDMKLNTTGATWGCFEDLPSDWQVKLKERVETFIPPDRIYTAYEFVNDDMQSWPSQQELIRRGKSVAFGSYRGFGCTLPQCFFFGHGTGSPNAVDVRSGDPDAQYNLGDRFVSTFYPSGNVCFANTTFVRAVENGFTFPTTYCVSLNAPNTHILLHPPNPLFLDSSTSNGNDFGTSLRPYSGAFGLNSALFRVDSHEAAYGKSQIQMIFDSGFYEIDPLNTNPNSGIEIGMAVVLTSSGGLVEITK